MKRLVGFASFFLGAFLWGGAAQAMTCDFGSMKTESEKLRAQMKNLELTQSEANDMLRRVNIQMDRRSKNYRADCPAAAINARTLVCVNEMLETKTNRSGLRKVLKTPEMLVKEGFNRQQTSGEYLIIVTLYSCLAGARERFGK